MYFEQIRKICPIVAGMYKNLKAEAQKIADDGIRRHVRYCRRIKCPVDITVIREVVNDAREGLAIYAENDAERLARIADEYGQSSLQSEHRIARLFRGMGRS